MVKKDTSKKIKSFILDYKTLTTLVILVVAALVIIIANIVTK
jgi:hypothetical protein